MRLHGISALQGVPRKAALCLALCGLLLAPAAATAVAATPESSPESSATATTPAEEAVEVLDEVTAALEQPAAAHIEGGPDLTTQLATVTEVYDDLPAPEQRRADRLLARPTDGGRGELVNYGSAPSAQKCNKRICVHWVERGKHAATGAGADGNLRTVPKWVNTALDEVTKVWTTEVERMRYRAPASDGNRGNPAGLSGHRLDVYIGEISNNGYYGYAVRENASTGSSYLVLDNDYANLPGSALDALRVTSAHEFFHVLQFAYRPRADAWLMETTATWMEEQVFDDINDNRQYLRSSALTHPGEPLDGGLPWFYGNWIFFEHLSQRHGAAVVRDIWQRVAAGKKSTTAIDRALIKRGSSLAAELAGFAASNTVPQKVYSEGAAYPRAKPAKKPRLGKARRSAGWQQLRIDHLAAKTVRYRHAGDLGKKWRIRVVLKGKGRLRGELLVLRKDGRLVRKPLVIKNGKAKAGASFATKKVKWVAVAVANASPKRKHDRTGAQVKARLTRG